jgi:archaellum component FlaF (FlaF/FlaG flagellin family)
MKKNRCRKLVSVSLFVLSISIYLAINTMYTSLVFNYEENLQNAMKAINERMLCYPQSLTVLKELISGS